jgi:hypothetical protein
MEVPEYVMSVRDGIVFLVFLVLFLSTGGQTQQQPKDITRNSEKTGCRYITAS